MYMYSTYMAVLVSKFSFVPASPDITFACFYYLFTVVVSLDGRCSGKQKSNFEWPQCKLVEFKIDYMWDLFSSCVYLWVSV